MQNPGVEPKSSSIREPQERAFPDKHFVFRDFVRFFCQVFSEPEPLRNADCRQSYKDYVPRYYRRLFGPGLENLTSRHVKWFRRLEPVFELSSGSRILDFGGGYGMDAILLAAMGYEVTFYETTRHHIGIAQSLAARFAAHFGPLTMHFVLARTEPIPQNMSAILVNEVAHHIEPVENVFTAAWKMLDSNGVMFLLEPNFFSLPVQLFFFRRRGFSVVETHRDKETGEVYQSGNEHIRTVFDWNRRAQRCGFIREGLNYTIPWGMRGNDLVPSELRVKLERTPLARELLASHVTLRFRKDCKTAHRQH